ncbi:helix-turn-helix transcriptional regulator [Bosea sp. 47.2.35]|uniref:helix-turn-helix domain-containing protein n=1 Tax=Bosea sp. 47.2.35 TaxID=2969304 RepID=UPI00214F7ABC|nr:helix-turn-helix transcriptional regulator [Bosea sp. 47.2.35]MCR4522152.1 helix-turn-helix domain-containing protein [Bosea sp. 47.2.35]
MKPTSKQLELLSKKIRASFDASGSSLAEIARIAGVDASQVSRIRSGQFKTLSHNLVQVCRALGVEIPRREAKTAKRNASWALAEASMRKIWDETPEGAKAITRMLDAIGDLQHAKLRR